MYILIPILQVELSNPSRSYLYSSTCILTAVFSLCVTGPTSPESPIYNNIPPIPYEQLQLGSGAVSPTLSGPTPSGQAGTPASEGSESLTRPLHPLKSFSVPGPPPHISAPNTSAPKHIGMNQWQRFTPFHPFVCQVKHRLRGRALWLWVFCTRVWLHSIYLFFYYLWSYTQIYSH